MKLEGAYNSVYFNTKWVCQTRVHKSLIGNLARHSLSLTGIRLGLKQARRVNDSTASFDLKTVVRCDHLTSMLSPTRNSSVSLLNRNFPIFTLKLFWINVLYKGCMCCLIITGYATWVWGIHPCHYLIFVNAVISFPNCERSNVITVQKVCLFWLKCFWKAQIVIFKRFNLAKYYCDWRLHENWSP